jgi:amidophosphoribosyltransferase
MWSDSPHEECGIFGIYSSDSDSAQLTLLGLYALQHRGQESAGIAVSDGQVIDVHKQMGLVAEIFNEEVLKRLKGHIAIGHTRYSTIGASKLLNAQPLILDTFHGPFAIGHNGNLTNANTLRTVLLERGATFTTSSDTEVAALLLVSEPYQTWEQRIDFFLGAAEGAYCLTIMTPQALYVIRDPWGFRPLCLGKLSTGGWVVASESCALDIIKAEYIREIAPGEALRIDHRGPERIVYRPAPRQTFCLFEYIYFARSDSLLQEQLVYQVRTELGRELAREAPVRADLVVGVPDSAIPAAIGYAQELGIPYGEALVRNRYIGRTFIQPDQSLRQQAATLKLNPLRGMLRGQRIVLVDDSIVRGTTCRLIVHLLRQAGVKEIHVRIASPPIKHPCFMGVDMATYSELLAHCLLPEEISAHMGADSLFYLSYAGLIRAVGQESHGFCGACFTGKYPVRVDAIQKSAFEPKHDAPTWPG